MCASICFHARSGKVEVNILEHMLCFVHGVQQALVKHSARAKCGCVQGCW